MVWFESCSFFVSSCFFCKPKGETLQHYVQDTTIWLMWHIRKEIKVSRRTILLFLTWTRSVRVFWRFLFSLVRYSKLLILTQKECGVGVLFHCMLTNMCQAPNALVSFLTHRRDQTIGHPVVKRLVLQLNIVVFNNAFIALVTCCEQNVPGGAKVSKCM